MRSCTTCGADNDGDAIFCSACASRLTDAEGEADPSEPPTREPPRRAETHPEATSSGMSGGRWLAVLSLVLTIGAGLLRLANRSSPPHYEPIDVPPQLVEAPSATAIRGEPPAREPSEIERALAGTWVAMGDDTPQRASSQGTMVQLEGAATGQIEPLQRCAWIELYDNLRGYQHECGVVNGEASLLDRTDPISGRRSSLGASLRWNVEGSTVHLEYDEDMRTPSRAHPSFRHLALELPAGESPFAVTQSLPDHADVGPRTVTYEVFSGTYLD
ncbi:MAG: hypothetical protein AB7S26_09450 [Sandaracinaceae bacterium]